VALAAPCAIAKVVDTNVRDLNLLDVRTVRVTGCFRSTLFAKNSALAVIENASSALCTKTKTKGGWGLEVPVNLNHQGFSHLLNIIHRSKMPRGKWTHFFLEQYQLPE
jgi:hypothetical protein